MVRLRLEWLRLARLRSGERRDRHRRHWIRLHWSGLHWTWLLTPIYRPEVVFARHVALPVSRAIAAVLTVRPLALALALSRTLTLGLARTLSLALARSLTLRTGPRVYVLRLGLLLPGLLPVPRPLQLLLPLPGAIGLGPVVATLADLGIAFTTPVPAALVAHLGPDPFREPATSVGPCPDRPRRPTNRRSRVSMVRVPVDCIGCLAVQSLVCARICPLIMRLMGTVSG
jgi:hypothetical protein